MSAADSDTVHWPRPSAAKAAWKNQTEIRHGDYRNSAADAVEDDDGGDDNVGTDCGCGSHSEDCCYRPAIASCKWQLANLPLCNCYAPDRETWVQKRL